MRLQKLKELYRSKAILEGNFTLASGQKSKYYIDSRNITFTPEGIWLVSLCLRDEIFSRSELSSLDSIGGMTLGADPLVFGFLFNSKIDGLNCNAFIIRKEAKSHGTNKRIEGPSIKDKKVVVVEDVTTTGGTLRNVVDTVREEGAEVLGAVTIVDRCMGGKELLAGIVLAVKSLP
jgi:orotate phosphoribosyltransferase